jgi:hypothetical protein
VNEGKIGDVSLGTAVAPRQVFSSVSLEGPLSVGLLDGIPLRVGLVRRAEVGEGRVGVGFARPAAVASRKIVSVGSLEDDLSSNSREDPLGVVVVVGLNAHSIRLSTVCADFRKIFIVGLKGVASKLRQVSIDNIPCCIGRNIRGELG